MKQDALQTSTVVPRYLHANPPATLLDILQVPIYMTDTSGKITYFNECLAKLWGTKPEIGQDFWKGYTIIDENGKALPIDKCPMSVCLKEKRAVQGKEIRILRPDGEVKTLIPNPQPIFDDAGDMTGAINVLIDITKVKVVETDLKENQSNFRTEINLLKQQMEEKIDEYKNKNTELKRSEERYHKMVEEVEDYAIILLDKDGIVRNWNKGAEKIKGYKDYEIIGKSFSNFYLPEDAKNGLPQKLLNEGRVNGKAIHEGWRKRKDGSRFWGSIVITALHDDKNNVIGFTKVTRDLTERKITEDKMKEYTNQLEFQNKELEQFAYAASHDMKEPLRKIHLYNTSIADNPNNKLDEKSRDFLNRSISATKRMTDLIEDLLTYSKTTSNLESFDSVDLNEIVEEIIQLHKEEFDQKKVKFNIGQLPIIKAVSFQMKQLMFNLINNSIKYKHPEREVVIEIIAETEDGRDLIQYCADPVVRYYKISVIDNGIGFESQYSERIFDIFQRLNNLPGTKGSGIGLAICKRIVQNHHGFIKASGVVNEGARFDIYLPIN
jgi:PAS domain S-box